MLGLMDVIGSWKALLKVGGFVLFGIIATVVFGVAATALGWTRSAANLETWLPVYFTFAFTIGSFSRTVWLQGRLDKVDGGDSPPNSQFGHVRLYSKQDQENLRTLVAAMLLHLDGDSTKLTKALKELKKYYSDERFPDIWYDLGLSRKRTTAD